MTKKIDRFEDLLCWQKARELVNAIFDLVEKSPLAKDYSTQDQLKRAAMGSMNNIAEGFGRFSKKDFIKFLDYASSSGLEVRSMLYVLLDRKYINKTEFDKVYQITIDHASLTLGLIRYLTAKSVSTPSESKQRT